MLKVFNFANVVIRITKTSFIELKVKFNLNVKYKSIQVILRKVDSKRPIAQREQ